MTRVWGGRNLERIYGRALPGDASMLIGESWDVVDRPEAQSVVIGGRYDGRTLGDLWKEEREAIFGKDAPDQERFPLLCKILDVQQNLSVQAHPTPEVAKILGGEPKSEYWYAATAEAGAKWYVGLKRGITREVFEKHVEDGTTPECMKQLPVNEGDALWVPSGRMHALGAGQMIFEIQENSDTTYRIFDWNRSGSDKEKRELHITEALQCIDFGDDYCDQVTSSEGYLVDGSEFRIQKFSLTRGEAVELQAGEFSVIALVSGEVECGATSFQVGDYFLIPANAEECKKITASVSGAVLLRVTWPRSEIRNSNS